MGQAGGRAGRGWRSGPRRAHGHRRVDGTRDEHAELGLVGSKPRDPLRFPFSPLPLVCRVFPVGPPTLRAGESWTVVVCQVL